MEVDISVRGFDEMHQRRARETRVAGALGTQRRNIHDQQEETTRGIVLGLRPSLQPKSLRSLFTQISGS